MFPIELPANSDLLRHARGSPFWRRGHRPALMKCTLMTQADLSEAGIP